MNYPGRGQLGFWTSLRWTPNCGRASQITESKGFLTDRPSGFGGATRFVKDDIDLAMNAKRVFSISKCDVFLHRGEAEIAGTARVFFHDLVHDGEPLEREGSPGAFSRI